MDNQETTTAVNPNAPKRGDKRNEKSVIREVSFNQNHGKDGSYILHGTPTKSNPKGIWAINKKVFENMAASDMVPPLVYAERIKGGTYFVDSEFVQKGDAWKRGVGVYNKDHFTTTNTRIERSKASVAEEKQIMLGAYYNTLFTHGIPTATKAEVKVIEEAPSDDGADFQP